MNDKPEYPPDDGLGDALRELMIKTGQPAHDLAANRDRRWTTDELIQDFDVLGFAAPFVVVVRKADQARGTLEFTHSPRVYFSFRMDTP